MTFARRLSVEMKKRALSQKRLSAEVGCSHSSISRICSGERNPSRPMALLLADYFALSGGARLHFLALAGFIEFIPDHTDAALMALIQDRSEVYHPVNGNTL